MEGHRLNVCVVTCLITLLALSESKLTYAQTKGRKPLVPAVFVFGDSTVDAGNNNVIATILKADFPPYGRDFVDSKPTGRYTNGRLSTDVLAGLAGLPDIVPAFLDPEFQGPQILTGATFASAASGYDDTTSLIVNVLNLRQQLKYFKIYRKRLANMVGAANANEIISRGLFALSTGTVDFTNNYYLNPITRAEYTVTEYQDLLLHALSEFIQNIYEEGATRFWLLGLPPFGCLPSQITLHNLIDNTCVEEFNAAAISFNWKVISLVNTLKPAVPGLKIAYIDIYAKLLDMIKNPIKYGFEEVRRGCCGTGLLEAGILCTSACPDPSKYVFWDSFHPTSEAYNFLAQDIFSQGVYILL